MSKLQRSSISLVLALAFFAAMADASTAQEDVREINGFSCKDIMIRNGGDRDIAIAFIHGYLLGKKGATSFNLETLAAATDKFIDHCLDNPTKKAVGVMGEFTK